MPTLIIPILQYPGSPTQCNKAKERNKKHTDYEEIKLPICRWHAVVYIENPKEPIKKPLRINKWIW